MRTPIIAQMAEWKQAGATLVRLFRTWPAFRYTSLYLATCMLLLYTGQLFSLSLVMLAGSCWFVAFVMCKCQEAEERKDGSDMLWAFLIFFAFMAWMGSLAALSGTMPEPFRRAAQGAAKQLWSLLQSLF